MTINTLKPSLAPKFVASESVASSKPIASRPLASRPLVIYHKGCRDGFCAAWVVWRFYPDAEFYAASYNNPAPDVTDRDVIMVDFSYPLVDMIRIAAAARSLLVLDHHKTAQAALASPEARKAFGHCLNTNIVFDMERSGAGLAWDEFFPGKPRPWVVDYVEDRDLWRFALKASKSVNSYIGTLSYDFDIWDDIDHQLRVSDAIRYGSVVVAKVDQYVAEVSGLTRIVTFEGYAVPCVNAPHVDISELLHALAVKPLPIGVLPSFSLGWAQHADGRFVYSLRSDGTTPDGGFDVSEIAKKYGGGGHKNAAGFKSDTLLV